jgi:hypothetical protein
MSEAEVYTLAQLLWQSAGQIDRFAEGQQLLTQQPEHAMYRRLTSVPKRPECQN